MMKVEFYTFNSLFAATKQDADIALKASTAYRRIVDALSEARQAINATNQVIDEVIHTTCWLIL